MMETGSKLEILYLVNELIIIVQQLPQTPLVVCSDKGAADCLGEGENGEDLGSDELDAVWSP